MIAQLDKKYIFTRPSKVYSRLLSYFFFEGRPATTKGRWFNPVTFYFLRKASSTKQIPESECPVFITGTGRSGSTILGKILSMHPDVGFLNEPKALWFMANPNDDIIGSYSSIKANFIIHPDQSVSTTANKVKSVYSSFLKQTGTRFLVDKYPEMIYRVEFLNAIFKNPKYIFLHRDPWETIASTQLWSIQNADNFKKEDWWGVENRKWNLMLQQLVPHDEYLSAHFRLIQEFNSQFDMAAVEWILTMNYGLKMLLKYPDKFLSISYNNLCNKPEDVLGKICEFIGLNRDKVFLEYGKHVIKNAQQKSIPAVHPILVPAIIKLSQKLGYDSQLPVTQVTE